MLRSGWNQCLENHVDPQTETEQMDRGACAGLINKHPRGRGGLECWRHHAGHGAALPPTPGRLPAHQMASLLEV